MKKYILMLSILSISNQKGNQMNSNVQNIQAVILAAGRATRFHTDTTKLAYPICGQPMILFPIKLLQKLNIPTIVVVGYQKEQIKDIIANENIAVDFITQEKQDGTGHAVACTKHVWNRDHILVMNGDVPFVTQDIITALYKQHTESNAAISFITSSNPDETAKAYGRVITTDNTISIIEAKDLQGNINAYNCVNAGIYLINTNFLQDYITMLNTQNASKEFYITDLVKIASEHNFPVTTIDVPFNTVRGINTFQELAIAEHVKQTELINHWMHNGVRFSFPHNVYIDLNVTIGQGSFIGNGVHVCGDTIIGQHCTVKEFSSLNNVILEDNVTIHSHSVLENAYIKECAKIGPFARFRNNVTIGEQCIIGNFVEVKNSTIDTETKAAHLTYIGDATVGAHVNIGAGTITCNYDGVNKHETIIKDHAFIGSNNALIAPITIGNNAFTAAGSTITSDVPDDALAIARAHQTIKCDYRKKQKQQPQLLPHQDSHKLDEFLFNGARVIHTDNSEEEQ
ncbi:MAG TPA: bifunctional UDP-N-acetylglucosamine diphosphorylase/glucosamine-1-phosphate N-acetyltransferase GlmU [Candidatus Babeliales bacterium]|jgi:bifunctional UDP-N-acetylglucosamine pyrophosphorylase/glucosamine-1-phosphate N-acetyltransferase|nr:bifunctional UDP-N-acetylglucosamine diphosphorylase/glucosamine-1-phosphate N-acetyltransferase GlmU [Candidatus Babeliales bacterium]